MFDTFGGELRRILPNDKQAIITHLTLGRGRICYGDLNSFFYEDSW